MNTLSNEARELLAGEYVLGTLRGAARLRFARLMREDADLTRRVRFWEERLQPLQPLVPIAPPASVYRRIEQRLGWTGADRARFPLPWRWALASLLVLGIGIGLWRPWQPAFEASIEVALGDDAGPPIWDIALDTVHGAVRVRAVGQPVVASDRDLELWLLQPGDAAPISLGLMPEESGREVLLKPSVDLASGVGVAVSVEPPGGSPTGSATGPIIYARVFLAE